MDRRSSKNWARLLEGWERCRSECTELHSRRRKRWRRSSRDDDNSIVLCVSSSFSSLSRLSYLCTEWCCPTTRQARFSDTSSTSLTRSTARRRPAGLRRSDAANFRITGLRALLAAIYFNRAFCRFRSIKPLRLVKPETAILMSLPVIHLLRYLKLPHHLGNGHPSAGLYFRLAKLRDDLLRCKPLPPHLLPPQIYTNITPGPVFGGHATPSDARLQDRQYGYLYLCLLSRLTPASSVIDEGPTRDSYHGM